MEHDNAFERKTRKVFHQIHLAHLADSYVAERHTKIIEPELMGLHPDFLSGCKCADLGCGSAAHGTVNLLQLGAGYVHALDLDNSFIEPATERLTQFAQFAGRWKLDIGSLMELPYPDDTFQFILCAGVIHHTSNTQRAVDEIFRVMRPDAKAYLSVTGRGGLLNRLFKEVLREEYQDNLELQEIVKTGQLENWIKQQLAELKMAIDADDDESYRASIDIIENVIKLIDNDLALSFVDLLEAPEYKTFTEAEWFSTLENSGFRNYYRFAKKPKYRNLRRIFAPLYYDYRNPLARLLYNDGSMNVVVSK